MTDGTISIKTKYLSPYSGSREPFATDIWTNGTQIWCISGLWSRSKKGLTKFRKLRKNIFAALKRNEILAVWTAVFARFRHPHKQTHFFNYRTTESIMVNGQKAGYLYIDIWLFWSGV